MASATNKPNEYRRFPQVTSSQDLLDTSRVHIIMNPNVLIVIPCYNEEVTIGSVVLRAYTYGDHVVVIDDGSTDRTADIAMLAGAEVIRHGVNKGKGAGVKTAFEHGKRVNANILVLIDGDGQHNPDEIPRLIAPLLNYEADVVNGSRFLEKDRHHVPVYRRIGQEVLTLLTNAGSGRKVTDSQSGFRAFSRKTFDCFSFKETGMGIESEMLMDAASANLQIKEVQIDVRYDVAGSTFNPVTHGFQVMGTVIKRLVRPRQPLISGIPGLLLLIAGIAMFNVLMLELWNIINDTVLDYAIIAVLSIVLGVLAYNLFATRKSVNIGQAGR